MLFFIKYFTLTFCATYIFFKSLNCRHSSKQYLNDIIFSAVLSLISSIVETIAPYSTLLFIILLSFFFFVITYPTAIELTMTTTIISYGLSYITFALATPIVALVTALSSSFFSYNHLITQLITSLIQVSFTLLLFFPKRMRKGMPFLVDKLSSTPLTVISLLLLYMYLILSNSGNSPIFITLYFIAFIFSLFIYIFWRNSITKTYIDKLRERDIHDLNSYLDELELRLKEIETDKDELAKLIHADNKLVPAMALAVESFIKDFSSASPQMTARGEELLDKLNTMTNDRKGILRSQDNKCLSKLPSTGLSSLDNLLIYMQQKAFDHNMELNVTADADIPKLTKDTISEEDLITITADLLDNAIIANSYCNGQRILFSIGRVDKFLSISVFDSGIPFTKEVLVDLGVTGHTTHKDDGGSGIGLITIYELTRKYRASLIIEEYDSKSALYTKRIAVLFNKRGNYILNTFRKKEEINYLKQRADLTILLKKEPAAK